MPPDELLRFVCGPDGEVAPDFSGRLPGRGAWIAVRRSSVEEAAKRSLFSRALKVSATAPDDLADRIDAGFEKAALSALGLARRTGDAVFGFEKVRAALKGRKAAVLISASDASDGGREKLAALAGNLGGDIAPCALFSRAAISSAAGVGASHGAIRRGAAATRFSAAVQRLERYRGLTGEDKKNSGVQA